MITRTLTAFQRLGASLGRPDISTVLVGSATSVIAVWLLMFAYRT